MKLKTLVLLLGIAVNYTMQINAQITERERPIEWDSLVFGGRFMDRFLPMPVQGELTCNTWGAANVIPRYVDNGIEDNTNSYWGGNSLLGKDKNYHLFVCGWPENSPKGHMYWEKSTVFHAVAKNSFGPYKVKDSLGPGHNPEVFQLQDGSYLVYVINGYYLSENLEGPWEYNKFKFDKRDRKIIEGLSNLSFAKREDGSYLMVCRGGGIWMSKTGVSPYNQITEKSVYPPVKGNFEDPLIWKTNIQYHMIVNDWLGRIAYSLRSKDGIKWKVDPGEAYLPGITKYEDGTKVDWFKYERIKVLQDKHGRATQAHFAVIDTVKWNDLENDNHSSKHVVIPLTVGRLLTVLNKNKINGSTKQIRIKIEAEEGFNPHTDINIKSLRFGATEEVNFGRGSTVIKTEKSGKDLIVTFTGFGNGLTDSNFAAKLIGKTSDSKFLFGFARLPKISYLEPALSAKMPEINQNENGFNLQIEIQNFGQVRSEIARLKIVYVKNEKEVEIASGTVSKLGPFQKEMVYLSCGNIFQKGEIYDVIITLNPDSKEPVLLHGKITPLK